jgi:hypothetical protein
LKQSVVTDSHLIWIFIGKECQINYLTLAIKTGVNSADELVSFCCLSANAPTSFANQQNKASSSVASIAINALCK